MLKGAAGIKRRSPKPGSNTRWMALAISRRILLSDPPSEKRILCGSHLDSVPNGGRYDGRLAYWWLWKPCAR